LKKNLTNTSKEVYQRFRQHSFAELWQREVPSFNQASPEKKLENVGLIRALGVVCHESGTDEEKAQLRSWLLELLHDPVEKVRRYAMAALPKIGAGTHDEAALLNLLKTTTLQREKKFLSQTLDKIGGSATLELLENSDDLSIQTEQKIKASVARQLDIGSVNMTNVLPIATDLSALRIHLRCRRGLETFVQDEILSSPQTKDRFIIQKVSPALVVLTPIQTFSLADLYTLRCFKTLGLVLGQVPESKGKQNLSSLAQLISSPWAQTFLKNFTNGAYRYRLELIGKGAQRGAVRLIVNEAYERCPEILNDPRQALWSVDVYPAKQGNWVELRPRLSPDPRFSYRIQDIPAASHPPLAACMVRLAGLADNEIVWDPFCGSGLELIERALQGGVNHLYGTDLSAEAIAISQTNLNAATLPKLASTFTCCDFRDYEMIKGLEANQVSLIITNPPMGRRVPIPDLQNMIKTFFEVAVKVLRPGGRLVFANPLKLEPTCAGLRLEYRQAIDLGGFEAKLEMYRKKA